MPGVSIPEARNRERARLSNLFERLAARLPQSNVNSEIIGEISGGTQTPSIPEEFSTALRNLSVIRLSWSEASHPRMRRKTVASTSSSSGSVTHLQENKDVDEFQVAEEKKYPFTFKHMIHKLYKKDDWLRTVKEVLEKSKRDFKPLAECALLQQNPSEWIDPNIKLKDVAYPRGAKKAGGAAKGRDLWRTSLSGRHGVNEPPAGGEPFRALKKRCVGIRKSISGRPSDDEDQNFSNESGKGATFVFAPTISCTEHPGREIYLHFPQVSPSDSCFSEAEREMPAPHSSVSPITPTSPTPLYTTGCAAGSNAGSGWAIK